MDELSDVDSRRPTVLSRMKSTENLDVREVDFLTQWTVRRKISVFLTDWANTLVYLNMVARFQLDDLVIVPRATITRNHRSHLGCVPGARRRAIHHPKTNQIV